MKKLLLSFLISFIILPCIAKSDSEIVSNKNVKDVYIYSKSTYRSHSESSYQHAYCSMYNGIEEYRLSDKTRVDCLTDTHAIEFDFANKWAESIGQALYYGLMTGKKSKVVLILENKCIQQQMIYYERAKRIGDTYNIDVEYISDEILKLNKMNRCQYKDCKCNKVKAYKKLSNKENKITIFTYI